MERDDDDAGEEGGAQSNREVSVSKQAGAGKRKKDHLAGAEKVKPTVSDGHPKLSFLIRL